MVSSYYEVHKWVPEAIPMSYTKQHLLWHLFSSLKWSFWMKTICPAPTVRPCWPARGTPSTACVKNMGFTWARQGLAVVSAANGKYGWHLHQPLFPQALGKDLVYFLTVSMYYSLNVQLFGGFWSRVSCARADFGPVESRKSSTPLRYRQKHPVNLQLPVAFSTSFMKWFILQLFPTKKG